jgi:hypothetical protein
MSIGMKLVLGYMSAYSTLQARLFQRDDGMACRCNFPTEDNSCKLCQLAKCIAGFCALVVMESQLIRASGQKCPTALL